MASEDLDILQPETALDRYCIKGCLGVGGFSIVYLAADIATEEQVIIKEYMPKKLAQRSETGVVVPREPDMEEVFMSCRQAFYKEATTLATLKHPNIVNVMGFFRANESVYMVMPYQDGKNLESYIRARHGNLSEKFIRTIFPPLLDGLRLVHERGLLHLDIKPSNIHVRPGGSAYLFDFGAVHKTAATRQDQLRQVVTPGFSPIEQHKKSGYVGAWTDIYAMGATIRACMEGKSPPTAEQRVENDCMKPATVVFKKRYSASLLAAVDWSMDMDPQLRPQSVDEFIKAFRGEDAKKVDDENDDNKEDLIGKIAGVFLGNKK